MNTKVAKDSKTAKDKAAKGTANSGGKGTSNKVTTNGAGIRKAGSKSKLNDLNGEGGSDKLRSPNKPAGGSLTSAVIDVEYLPLAVDLCHWVAEQTQTCLEIEQFVSCMQDGIVLCRLVNAISKLRCERYGEPFKLVHFRENIGNSVFFARINIETFIRWSKNFGVTDTCSVSDLVDLKDIMQALNNVYNVARKCAELGLPHPPSVALELEHSMRYNDIVGLFDPDHGPLSKEETAAKVGLINIINNRGLGALRSDSTLVEQLGNWRKRLVGKWAGTEIKPPTPEPLPPTPTPPPTPPPILVKKAVVIQTPLDSPPEAKMGPWDNEEIVCLIELYRHQIDEFGDDHIDFQLLSKNFSKRFKHRTPHQCWDKMYQLIERYQCDRSANRLFKRKVCSGPHHDQLHLTLGDTDLAKHLNAVYTGMSHGKAPSIPSYIECDAGEKAEAEKSGKEQIAEQTVILRSINDNLIALKEQTERNATTNAAVLVLLTHVLKGESLENGDRAASEAASQAASLLSNSNGSVEKIPAAVDSDSKSLASDADIPEKISECSENESAGVTVDA
ncbi:uncharacterized protein LOC134819349 isoform X3 [Bolinopsis microptera]|uniref:uncharacterized protein LOC134819349 isoform X3 n=1 Tax=Bolinopsis microptera TaxID=2820187 RepID=UPI0030792BF9